MTYEEPDSPDEAYWATRIQKNYDLCAQELCNEWEADVARLRDKQDEQRLKLDAQTKIAADARAEYEEMRQRHSTLASRIAALEGQVRTLTAERDALRAEADEREIGDARDALVDRLVGVIERLSGKGGCDCGGC